MFSARPAAAASLCQPNVSDIISKDNSGPSGPWSMALQALLRPFACDVGVVRLSDDELRKRRES